MFFVHETMMSRLGLLETPSSDDLVLCTFIDECQLIDRRSNMTVTSLPD